MGRVGRRLGFVTGGVLGMSGALLCALALQLKSFLLLCLGTALIGALNGFSGYGKYVAAEVVPAEHKVKQSVMPLRALLQCTRTYHMMAQLRQQCHQPLLFQQCWPCQPCCPVHCPCPPTVY